MIQTFRLLPLALLAIILQLTACKREAPEIEQTPTPVPDTYDFPFVNYSGQTDRLDQLGELIAYLETANTMGVQLDPSVINKMFSNTNGDADGNFSFTSEKDMESKCFEPHLDEINAYFSGIVDASKSVTGASNGVAGVMYDTEGGSGRLFDANGLEYSELIEKRIMGAMCYYQATAIYLDNEKMEVDNDTIVAGEGTAMAHYWDEAYGYFGVTKDFPENIEDVRYWGKYCVRRNAMLNSVETVSEAFRAGRAGITWHRYTERDSAISLVREEWENVVAGTAVHYLNEALRNFGVDHSRNHVLSEAVGFIESLFYNPEKRITESKIDEALELIGSNYYEVTAEDIQAARDLIATVYGWESIKSSL